MEITDFGHFKPSNPDSMGILFYVNEDGYDWYEMRRSLTEWDISTGGYVNAVYGVWATIDPATMLVMHVEYDPSRLVPDNRIVVGIDAALKDIQPGMIYRDGQLVLSDKEDAA